MKVVTIRPIGYKSHVSTGQTFYDDAVLFVDGYPAGMVRIDAFSKTDVYDDLVKGREIDVAMEITLIS